MSALLLAARYLTILPFPGRVHGDIRDLGRSAAWFPVVGLGIGVMLVVVEVVTMRVFPSLLAALLVVTAWKLVTGGLHLDGLADCLDGLVGHDAEHRLAIMRDSRIGAFGAIGLILFLLLVITAVSELPPAVRWRALLAGPAIARATPPVLGVMFPAARRDGHGAAFRAGLGRSAAPLAIGLSVVVAVAALGLEGFVAVAVALLAALGLGKFLTLRLDGLTGDTLGASIEVAELCVLLTVSAWTHARLT